MSRYHWQCCVGSWLSLVCLTPLFAAEPQPPREPIGSVLGKTVYRDDIKTREQGPSLESELHRLFTQPVMQKYVQEHQKEVTPSKEELAAATAFFQREHAKRMELEKPAILKEQAEIDARLKSETLTAEERKKLTSRQQILALRQKPPGEQLAHFILDSWKFQKHLYDSFGGGRILWQQAGQEAFDAMHKWLQSKEDAGDFQITDPELRQKFYHYWTTQNHGAFLTDNKDRIREEFLEPPWLKPVLQP